MANRIARAARAARIALAALTLVAASGCATLPEDPSDRAAVQAVNDPFEPANRMVFAFNEAVDVFLIRPAAVVYRDLMPDPGKQLVFNFVRHIGLPLTIVNDVLQGEWDRAGVAAKRFFVNSIAGVGGIADAATGVGLPHHKEDFGQTLAKYQASAGPYIVLPIIGPSSGRHTVGRIFDIALDPVTYIMAGAPIESTITNRAMSIVDQRYRLLAPLDDVKRTSFDYYAAVRSLYRQRRQVQIRDLDHTPPAKAQTAAVANSGAHGG